MIREFKLKEFKDFNEKLKDNLNKKGLGWSLLLKSLFR